MRFRPSAPQPEKQQQPDSLSESEINTLAIYNSERARGIMHTPEWQTKMAVLQARFDARSG